MNAHTRIAVLVGVGTLGSVAMGQNQGPICVTNLVEVGSIPTDDWAQHTQVVGTTMYVADGLYGLKIMDISDLGNPVLLSQEASGGMQGQFTSDVTVVGDVAYVTDYFGGLNLFDVSNPAGAVRVGGTQALSGPNGIEVVGSYAYIADGLDGLVVVDVSNPAMPTVVGSYNTPGNAQDVAIENGYAYIADGIAGGLEIIDVIDPSNPVGMGSYPMQNNTLGIDVRNQVVFVAGGGSGLVLFDVSDPMNPVLLDATQSPGRSVWDVEVQDSRAYIAINGEGVMAVNIANPSNIIEYEPTKMGGAVRNISFSGFKAYASDSVDGIVVLDIVQNCTFGCPVDYNEDGVLNFFDVSAFIAAYQAGCP